MSAALKTNLVILVLFLFVSGCATTGSNVPKQTEEQARILKEQMPAQPAPEAVMKKKETIAAGPVLAQQTLTEAPEVAEVPRVTYVQITNLISEFLDIKEENNTPAGQPRYLGLSENKLVTLEIVGDKEKVAIASIKLIYPDDIENVSADLNNAMMLRFLKNVAPEIKEWSISVKDIMNKFSSMQIGQTKEEDIALQHKMIKILYDKTAASVTVTVRIRQ
jgi:hypothetical protein